jgi:hypothetical protein
VLTYGGIVRLLILLPRLTVEYRMNLVLVAAVVYKQADRIAALALAKVESAVSPLGLVATSGC